MKVSCNLETKCWEWTGAKNNQGYGILSMDKKEKRAHRVSYELFKNKINPKLVVDHMCHNKSCVNPNHLDAVTHAVNGSRERARHWNSLKTHCNRGHEYTEENTYFTMRKYGHNGWKLRTCKKCKKIWQDNRKKNGPKIVKTLEERFLEKVDVLDKGCWEWKASKVLGYGKFKYQGEMRLAHRISYMIFVGSFDESLTVDHMCSNRGCVNPKHLQILTREENSRLGGKSNAKKNR